jgi:TetR/AcrR family transcriptional repressor of mexJK operon
VKSPGETPSTRKKRLIAEAATRLFIDKGYDGTSMEDVARLADVSKPTVYKHFADKEKLFSEIIRATTDQVDGLVSLVSESLSDANDVEKGLTQLAHQFLQILMQPAMLRLRRLVVATADRFPEVGRTWYDGGFERVLSSLAKCFQQFADRDLLRLGDPVVAANHFVGLLLWIPLNRAMFRGDEYIGRQTERERHAELAVRAFLKGYGPTERGRKISHSGQE